MPEWLTSNAAMVIIAFSALAVFVGNLNTLLDFLSRFRKKPMISAEIEQYRGNLIRKFRDLDKEVYSEIRGLKEKMSPPIAGAQSVDEQIEFLQEFRVTVDNIRKQTFLALDRGNIVEAHETLNDLRKLAIENRADLKKHENAYEASMGMWMGGRGFYGAKIALTKIKIRTLEELLEDIQ